METSKRGKPQQWSDEKLKEIALEIKYKYSNCKLTPLFLERESGIGRNTWSRRMTEFINKLNNPVHIPNLTNSDGITIPSVDDLFLKFGRNPIELKNEVAKFLNIITDLYRDSKKLEENNKRIEKLELEVLELRGKLETVSNQKKHYEAMYNQIVTQSYFPHLYEQSVLLREHNLKSPVVPLPKDSLQVLNLKNPNVSFSNSLKTTNLNTKSNEKIKKLNNMFDLDIE